MISKCILDKLYTFMLDKFDHSWLVGFGFMLTWVFKLPNSYIIYDRSNI